MKFIICWGPGTNPLWMQMDDSDSGCLGEVVGHTLSEADMQVPFQ